MKYIGTISLSLLLALSANAAPPAGDTIRITLTNECKLRSVTADAVKIVKRY